MYEKKTFLTGVKSCRSTSGDKVLFTLDWENHTVKYACKIEQMFKSLKSGSPLPKKNCFIGFNERPLKMINDAFYFILKALFIVKLSNFFS